jgi:hypothetical protein
MEEEPLLTRRLVAFARAEAFSGHTLTILARLGYPISIRSAGEGLAPEEQPELILADERRLSEALEAAGDSSTPIISMTGRHGTDSDDPRIVGAIARPVGMHDLYRVLQLVFEDTPRSAPRVPTRLAAVCRRSGREWNASVLSLSENGCLLRTPEPVPLGSELQLAFELPSDGTVHVRAETAFQLVPDLGLVFSSIAPKIRMSITGFVADMLLETDPAAQRTSR